MGHACPHAYDRNASLEYRSRSLALGAVRGQPFRFCRNQARRPELTGLSLSISRPSSIASSASVDVSIPNVQGIACRAVPVAQKQGTITPHIDCLPCSHCHDTKLTGHIDSSRFTHTPQIDASDHSRIEFRQTKCSLGHRGATTKDERVERVERAPMSSRVNNVPAVRIFASYPGSQLARSRLRPLGSSLRGGVCEGKSLLSLWRVA
jgi:hypothetical protein